MSFALLSFAKEAQAKGKHSPGGRESGGGGPEVASKPVGDVLRGGAAEPARGNEESGRKGHGGGTAEPIGALKEAASIAPKADGLTSSLDAKPVAKHAARALGEAAGNVRPTVDRIAESAIEGKTGPLVEPLKEATDPVVAPDQEAATGAVEPAVEPLLQEVAAPVIDPVLDTAAPVAVPPLGDVTPASQPPLEGMPATVEPDLGSITPLFEAVEPAAAPVALAPVFGEDGRALLLLRSGEWSPPAPPAPVSLPAISSPVLGPVAGYAASDPSPAAIAFLGSGVEEALHLRLVGEDGASSETPGNSGPLLRLFDGSLVIGGLRATLHGVSDTTVVKGIADLAPLPLPPFDGFPFGVPPVGSSFGGSGSGVGLDLLTVLALLAVLSRVGGSSRSPREILGLVSSPRLVAELPG